MKISTNNLRVKNTWSLVIMFAIILSGCNSPDNQRQEDENLNITVKNTLDKERNNVFVHIPAKHLKVLDAEHYIVMNGVHEIPSQYNEKGQYQGLVLVLDQLAASEIRELTIKPSDAPGNYNKRTQAELSIKEDGEWKGREYMEGSFKNVDSLRVPDEHTDHSWYIRYEGPGWESDKVGYRFYLDWRNATDVFGKTKEDVVLHDVGQDGFDSYHEMQDWGMDVLKVGSSLGIGSPALFTQGRAVRIDSTDSVISKVLVNGDVYSAVQTNYFGWEVANKELDVESVYSIHAGSRITHHHMEIKGNPDNIATGIGKSDSARYYSERGNELQFGYLATFGTQSLNNDKLGLAVLFPADNLMEITEDAHSHIVKLQPSDGSVDYYFLAAWELEKNGITSEQEFRDYVHQTAIELASPVQVTISNNSEKL